MVARVRNRSEKVLACIRENREFTGSNLYGREKVYGETCGTGRLVPNGDEHFLLRRAEYVVYSYETPIAAYVPGIGWWVNSDSYSPTTRQHQGIVRRALGDIPVVTTR